MCLEERTRAEHQRRVQENDDSDQLSQPEQRSARAEHCHISPFCKDLESEEGRSCRAELCPAQIDAEDGCQEMTRETDQAEQVENASAGCQDQAEQASSRPETDSLTTSASQITQKARQCHTRTWPVARYVDLPSNINHKPMLTQNIHIGPNSDGGQDRAELQPTEAKKNARGQDEQNCSDRPETAYRTDDQPEQNQAEHQYRKKEDEARGQAEQHHRVGRAVKLLSPELPVELVKKPQSQIYQLSW